MKPIAIHYLSYGWTQRWIQYCEMKAIPFKKVNCYRSDIISQLRECSALLWHWNYENYRDKQFANKLIFSAEQMGLKVLPNYACSWHFDDKVAQKYLLESIREPHVNTWVFYDKSSAFEWIGKADFPLIFKLTTGAGSQNVRLIKSMAQAKEVITVSFGHGFSSKNYTNIIKDRYKKTLKYQDFQSLKNLFKSVFRAVKPASDFKFINRERGYVYFQEYLAGNDFDTRLVVIGKRCFGFRRFNRENDFRASGSSSFSCDPEKISIAAVQIAFSVAKKMDARTLALDFLFDDRHSPLIVEISYAFPVKSASDNCPGYWDSELCWHPGKQNLQHLMIDDLLGELP